MNPPKGFRLHPGASQDIANIWEYIAHDNPVAAERVRQELLDAIRHLVKFPHIGHRRADLTSRPIRFWVVRRYLIAYAPDEIPLLILAVLHGSRSPRIMAAILRGRK